MQRRDEASRHAYMVSHSFLVLYQAVWKCVDMSRLRLVCFASTVQHAVDLEDKINFADHNLWGPL